jgi:hypothetical protein
METDDGDRFDLTGKIVIRGRAPEFIGSYSVVYRGQWAENAVRFLKFLYRTMEILKCRPQVAVKIIRSVGALSTMRRVGYCSLTRYYIDPIDEKIESVSREDGLGVLGTSKYTAVLWSC